MNIVDIKQLSNDQINAVMDLIVESQYFQRVELDGHDNTKDELRKNWTRTFREQLEDSKYGGFAAVEGDKMAGYIRTELGKQALIVDDLWVSPEYRKQGLAKRLMNKAIEIGKSAGKNRVALTVARSNEGAKKLYETLGFSEVPSEYIDSELKINGD
jgi:ribosomal protein S18 acetylase RimI-like enzyme